jgi:DNA-binding MarR family transcriptional regulator/N-acetylglutamate synthase-like GNAT family acetyltransferase
MNHIDQHIHAVLRFLRFYSNHTDERTSTLPRDAHAPGSRTEIKVLHLLSDQTTSTVRDIARALRLDPGHITRVVKKLESEGLLAKVPSTEDRRSNVLRLSPTGRTVLRSADAEWMPALSTHVASLRPVDQMKLVEAMGVVQELLDPESPHRPHVSYRPHRPGDIGWIIQRHGEAYHDSHGWDESFEVMVAEVAAKFARDYDPATERSWIAEVDGARSGSVVLTRKSKWVAQLRLLFVDPTARGLGIGGRLVSECVGHARHVGYRKIVLFTVQGLNAARRLYEAEGFQLTSESPGHAWGGTHIAQTWELHLTE